MKFRRTRRLAISGKRDIHQATRVGGHLPRHELAMQGVLQKPRQLPLEEIKIDRRRAAPGQVVYLAIDARPIAGIVHIQVDPHRNATRPAGNHGIHIAQPGAVAPVVVSRQHPVIV